MNFHPNRKSAKKKRGYTLLEVASALFIFTLISAGMTAIVVHSDRISYSVVFRNAANLMVQGYLEQIRSLALSQIKLSIANPSTTPLQTMNVLSLQSSSMPGDLNSNDYLYLNQSNSKTIKFDVNAANSSNPIYYTMQLLVTPTITDLSNTSYGAQAIPAYAITLNFQYEVRHKLGSNIKDSSVLQIVIASI